MSKLTEEQIKQSNEAIEKSRNIFKNFRHLWGMVEKRLGEPLTWIEWRESTGILNSCLNAHHEILRESFVKYCDFTYDEEYDKPHFIESNVGTYDTDYPIIFFANIVNGEIIGNWVQPHHFYDYWSFRDSIIIDTGSIPNVMPLVLCSIGLPEVFEQNRDNDSLHANLWLYSRDLFEEEEEDMGDVSLYAEGGIG